MTANLDVDVGLTALHRHRPMKVGSVWAPWLVRVEGDLLIYSPGHFEKHKNVLQGLLRQFLESKASRESVIRFCEKWGVLGLCSHGLPAQHAACELNTFTETVNGQEVYCRGESIESVQNFAGALESLFRIGIEMSFGRPGKADDWRNADETISGPDFVPWHKAELQQRVWEYDVAPARTYLQILLGRLIQICQLVPRFFWNEETKSWQIDLDSPGASNNLPALLVIELMVTIADKDGFAICSSCHRAYVPKRKPDSDRRNYCDCCGPGAAQRDASREYRRRIREARKKSQRRE